MIIENRTRFSGIIFDFDGVIADSMELQEKCWKNSVNTIPNKHRQQVKRQIVNNLYSGFSGEKMFDGVDATETERRILRKTKDSLWQNISLSTPLMRHARKTILRLQSEYSLFIATTAPKNYAEHILKRENIHSAFELVVGNEDVINPKPHPEMIELISVRSTIDRQFLCLIGDSITDEQLAKNADICFFAFGDRWKRFGDSTSKHIVNWTEISNTF